MAGIGDLVATLGMNNAPFKKSAQESKGILAGLGASITSGLGGITGQLTALLGVGSAIGTIGWGMKLAADAEQTQIAFEVMLGSADKARAILGELKAYADKSPFGGMEVNEFAQQLANYGIQAQDLVPTIKQLGDIAAGDANKFRSLATAFGQTVAMGKLQGGEKNQFINAGFNPLQEISRTSGESMASLTKRMEAGTLSVNEVANALRTATSEGGRFFGMTDRQAGTAAGKFSTLKDAAATAMRDIGASIMENMDTSGWMDKITEALTAVPSMFANAGKLVEIEIINWQLYLDGLIPGAATTMQDIGIIFQAGWEGAGTFFQNFLGTVRGGFEEMLNLSSALQSAWNATDGKRTWGQWAKEQAVNTLQEGLQKADVLTELGMGGKSTGGWQKMFGFKSWEQTKDANQPNIDAFNKTLAEQKDVVAPNAFAESQAAFTKKMNDLAKGSTSGTALTEKLKQAQADAQWEMALRGEANAGGYGSATTDLGGKLGDSFKGATAEDKKKKTKLDKADNEAALAGSAAANKILTSGASTNMMKKSEDLSAQQLLVMKQMKAAFEQREFNRNMDFMVANF